MTAAVEEARRMETAPSLPAFLTHYYRDEPFRTLSDLSSNDAATVLEQIGGRRELEYRLTRPEYLPRRREIEAMMREAFVTKGGLPKLAHPHYFIAGTFSLYEDDADMQSVRLPIEAFDPEAISFTYTDSFFAYNDHNLRGIPIPPRPYHGQVFTLDELPALVERYGLPGERWRDDPERRFDVYIEAQVWDDAPLQSHMGGHRD